MMSATNKFLQEDGSDYNDDIERKNLSTSSEDDDMHSFTFRKKIPPKPFHFCQFCDKEFTSKETMLKHIDCVHFQLDDEYVTKRNNDPRLWEHVQSRKRKSANNVTSKSPFH